MSRSLKLIFMALAIVGLTLTVASCGKSSSTSSTGQEGGTLKVLANGDVDYIDPGAAYFQFTYMITYATQRPLYSWKPEETKIPTPDLATGPAKITNDGKTVTVDMRDDVKYSAPVNRVATSADVKYAIERAFKPNVANGYATAYFGNIVGVKGFQDGEAKEISGITTPSDTQIVFKLTSGTGAVLAQALSLPISVPVPESYAKKYDAKSPSTYGENQVFTGPYQVASYKPGKSIQLTRNPNWDKSTDYRPAYLDSIDVSEGNSIAVASRQIIDGQSQVNGDFATPPPAQLKQYLSSKKDQVDLVPSGGNRYVAINTTIEPFDDINVRKALLANADRDALRLTRGGAAIGDVATHFIPPEVPGFEEAGGKGTEFDFLKNPKGDPALAASYMKKAGYKSGKYDGDKTFLTVGDVDSPGDKTSQVVQNQFEKLGFKLNLKLVPRDAVFTKYCGSPKAAVVICPTIGWAKDFNDGETLLNPTFNGDNIEQSGNVNYPQLDDEKINAAMKKASVIVDLDERAQAWGDIDKMITAQAPAIPWVWDNNANIKSTNVNGVVNKFNAQYDLSFSSLK